MSWTKEKLLEMAAMEDGCDVSVGGLAVDLGFDVSPIETWPCNDCGLPCLKGDEFCGPCYEKQRIDEMEEAMHPEWRCPPRE